MSYVYSEENAVSRLSEQTEKKLKKQNKKKWNGKDMIKTK